MIIGILINITIQRIVKAIAWLSIGDRAFNIAMFACMPPLLAVVLIGMCGNG